MIVEGDGGWTATRTGIVRAKQSRAFGSLAELRNEERRSLLVALCGIVAFVLTLIIGTMLLDYLMPASFVSAKLAAVTLGQ